MVVRWGSVCCGRTAMVSSLRWAVLGGKSGIWKAPLPFSLNFWTRPSSTAGALFPDGNRTLFMYHCRSVLWLVYISSDFAHKACNVRAVVGGRRLPVFEQASEP